MKKNRKAYLKQIRSKTITQKRLRPISNVDIDEVKNTLIDLSLVGQINTQDYVPQDWSR